MARLFEPQKKQKDTKEEALLRREQLVFAKGEKSFVFFCAFCGSEKHLTKGK
jgi:cell division protein FtsL